MDDRATFLVEHYLPGRRPAELSSLAGRIRAELGPEQPVRLLTLAVVPADETVLCLVEGGSEQLVCEAYDLLGVDVDRISAAIVATVDPGTPSHRLGSEPERRHA